MEKVTSRMHLARKPTGEECPECGGELVYRVNSWNGEIFVGCKLYPFCKFTKDLELS